MNDKALLLIIVAVLVLFAIFSGHYKNVWHVLTSKATANQSTAPISNPNARRVPPKTSSY